MSAAFRFRLARVLRARRASEESARRNLAEAQRSVAEHEERVGALSGERARAGEDRRELLGGRVDPGMLVQAAAFEASLERNLEARAKELRTSGEVADVRRVALVAAAQRVRVLERLEERRRSSWTAERNLEEQKAVDDRAPRAEPT